MEVSIGYAGGIETGSIYPPPERGGVGGMKKEKTWERYIRREGSCHSWQNACNILFYSMSFLQMRKPRLREVKEHFQDHTATKEQRLDLNMGLCGSKSMYVPYCGPSFSQGRMDGSPGSSHIALISTSFFVL